MRFRFLIDVVDIEFQESVSLGISVVVKVLSEDFRYRGISFRSMIPSVMFIISPDIFCFNVSLFIRPCVSVRIGDLAVLSVFTHLSGIFFYIEHPRLYLIIINRSDTVAADNDLLRADIIVPSIQRLYLIGRSPVRRDRIIVNTALAGSALILIVIDRKIIFDVLGRTDSITVLIDDHFHDLDCYDLVLAVFLVSEDKVHAAVAPVIRPIPSVVNDRTMRPQIIVASLIGAGHTIIQVIFLFKITEDGRALIALIPIAETGSQIALRSYRKRSAVLVVQLLTIIDQFERHILYSRYSVIDLIIQSAGAPVAVQIGMHSTACIISEC